MAEFNLQFDVIRKDEGARRVYGWFSVANDASGQPLIDRHGDVIKIEDLDAAASKFVQEYRQGGENHTGGAPHSLVASLVFTPEIKKALNIPEGTLPDGWFGGFEIDEQAFNRLNKGDLLMFSIEGEAQVEEVEV